MLAYCFHSTEKNWLPVFCWTTHFDGRTPHWFGANNHESHYNTITNVCKTRRLTVLELKIILYTRLLFISKNNYTTENHLLYRLMKIVLLNWLNWLKKLTKNLFTCKITFHGYLKKQRKIEIKIWPITEFFFSEYNYFLLKYIYQTSK